MFYKLFQMTYKMCVFLIVRKNGGYINKVKSAENNCKLFCTTFLVLTIFNNLPQGSHFILVEITLESVSGTDRAQ